MTDIVATQSNCGYIIPFDLVDSAGAPRDITGFVATFRVWNPKTNVELFSGTCSPVNLSIGKISYTVKSTDFSALGFYYGTIRLTKTNYVEDQLLFTVEVIAASV